MGLGSISCGRGQLPALLQECGLLLELAGGSHQCQLSVTPSRSALHVKAQAMTPSLWHLEESFVCWWPGLAAAFSGMISALFSFLLDQSTEQRCQGERSPGSPLVPPCCLSWWPVSLIPMIPASWCAASLSVHPDSPTAPVPQSGCTASASLLAVGTRGPSTAPLPSPGFELPGWMAAQGLCFLFGDEGL